MSSKEIVAFVLGAAAGIIAALLLAPKSGEDLRSQLAREAQQDRDRVQREYTKAVGDVHQRLDKVQADVQATLRHLREEAEEATAAE